MSISEKHAELMAKKMDRQGELNCAATIRGLANLSVAGDKRIAELEQQLNELKANNARMREAFNEMDVSLISMGSDGTKVPTNVFQEALRVFGSQPKQSLAEIQADAVEEMLNMTPLSTRGNDLIQVINVTSYIKQLRNNQSEVDK